MEVRRVPPPSSRLYQEFLRSKDLSVGIYRLQPGATDDQQPHEEDELYYVLAGRARFTSGERTVDVEPGVCLFVPARETHQFHHIVETLELLVVFGPSESASPR
jgi:mannose-6-phosphate isomerase-like protein (cupin superfamily)